MPESFVEVSAYVEIGAELYRVVPPVFACEPCQPLQIGGKHLLGIIGFRGEGLGFRVAG